MNGASVRSPPSGWRLSVAGIAAVIVAAAALSAVCLLLAVVMLRVAG